MGSVRKAFRNRGLSDQDVFVSAIVEAILWGATGQARVLRECLGHLGISVVALFDNDESVRSPFEDVAVLGGRVAFEAWVRQRDARTESTGFLAAVGGERGADRFAIHTELVGHGLVPLRVVHPTAFVADDTILGEGSQILAQSAVCVGVELGVACIVNTAASVDHECKLGDGVHVCPGARLAGCVIVERFATIGIGASVLPRMRVGEGAVVGAGAVVIDHVEPYTVVVGVPARPVSKRIRVM